MLTQVLSKTLYFLFLRHVQLVFHVIRTLQDSLELCQDACLDEQCNIKYNLAMKYLTFKSRKDLFRNS